MNTSYNAAAKITACIGNIEAYIDGDEAVPRPTQSTSTVRQILYTLPIVSFNDAVQEAAGLIELDNFDDNPEYVRGICELVARLFGESVIGSEGDTSYGVDVAMEAIVDNIA